MDKEKKELLEIEEAFELIEQIDFQIFVDRLAKYQTMESINYWFGDRVKELPDIKKIYTTRDQLQAATLVYIEDYVFFPDQKLRLQNHLGFIARALLRSYDTLYKIRQGETVWLNMEAIGHLWGQSEILKKYRNTLQNFESKKIKQSLTLEDIFSNKNDLNKLVKVLTAKGFVSIESGSPIWTGIKHDRAKGPGLQLVALSEVCQPLYKRNNYQAKELHKAWTKFFNYSMANTKWKPSEAHNITEDYKRLFNFLLNSISVN